MRTPTAGGIHAAEERPSPPGTRVLSAYPVALSSDFEAITDVISRAGKEHAGSVFPFAAVLNRLRALRRSWRLFVMSAQYAGVITVGDLEGLAFAALLRLRGRTAPVHVMYDCLWYGGGRLRQSWMRFCLAGVDRCIVWASVEKQRYARAYRLESSKFAFVPHHHTMKHYSWESGDDGYIFTGGNADRDFAPLFAAVRELGFPCVLATNRRQLLRNLDIPHNVRVVSVSPSEFRQLMAKARMVVMPMRATLLHAGAQQSILNAMLMGKPVVLTDVEGGADYIESGKTGVLTPYGDVGALRESIRELWQDPEAARAMGARGREFAFAMTVERTNNEMWELALRLIQEKGKPGAPVADHGSRDFRLDRHEHDCS